MSNRTQRYLPLLVCSFIVGFAVSTKAGTQDRKSHTAVEWSDAAIGLASGKVVISGNEMILSSTGTGINANGADSGRFLYVVRSPGDFEVVTRIKSVSGSPRGVAGIMVRQDMEPKSSMASVTFNCVKNAISWTTRLPETHPGNATRVLSGGTELAHGVPASGPSQPSVDASKGSPLWLRMVRIGGNFAVYKSRDGKFWLPVSNVSGGPISVTGSLKVGLFVSGGSPGSSLTAVFDSTQVGPATMRYKTSWVGNSFGSRDSDNHVSNALSAMWVAPDGTCYTSSYWDEGGQPVTSYRDGKVARPLPVGTPQTAEGGITGDGRYIYVAAVDHVMRLDPRAQDFAPIPILFNTSLLDKKTNNCAVSGMASNGKELFVADSRDNTVHVAVALPVPTFQVPTAANDGMRNAPEPVSVPTEPGYAPTQVYQSQRVGEGIRYTLPGFNSGEAYTLRCHFAEYVKRDPSADPRNLYIDIGETHVNVGQYAGGILKACFKEFPGYKANDKGEIIVNLGSYGGPGICGLEVLDSNGKRKLAINCGGVTVGDFQGEAPELLDRAFKVERPGPMVFDRRGDLWIVQRGNDAPIGNVLTAKYKAAVRCYRADGTFTGRQINDLVNPRALGYDSARDELLVGENGPDLNVRIYSGLGSVPALARSFGQKGGIYAGQLPGVVLDPKAGPARFAGISGLGVDGRGNIYVGGGFQGSDLRCFQPDGRLSWMLNSLMFCNTYDFDPEGDGVDLYGTYNHVRLDLTRRDPGTEQRYISYNWDLRKYGEPDRASNSQAIVRRLGAERKRILFTSGQGSMGATKIFRYEGELAIPAGEVQENGHGLWIDANGDGKVQSEEVTRMSTPVNPTGLVVDSKGDIWLACTTTAGSFMRHFKFKGLNMHGVPLYSGLKGSGYEDIPFPEEGEKTNGWGMGSRLDYDADRDILVAFYPRVPRTGESDRSASQYLLARYDYWSKGNRKPRWKFKALRPETEPDYFMYEVNLFPYSGYMGMKVVGDYVFFAYLFGEVHVFDLNTGRLAEVLVPGPEVNGMCAWEDASMGLRATRTKSGEYLILTENSGWGGKDNLYRWKPGR